MAIRTIDAPGIEIREIDKSQYSLAMTGTKVLVTGFANSGEDYIPMIFTSKSAWLNYYGEPDNEAERYFYAASMEVLNQNGVVNCCKLPYENEARDQFVGQKYKLITTNVGTIKTVAEALEDEDLKPIRQVLPNSKKFVSDVIEFFMSNCNVTDSTDKKTLQDATVLDTLNNQVNTVERSDDKTDYDGKNFFEVYGNDELYDVTSLTEAFIAQMTKAQLIKYVDDLKGQSTGLIPRLNAYYFIENREIPYEEALTTLTSGVLTSDNYIEQKISVVMACDEVANYAILTADNIVNISSEALSDFVVTELNGLVVSDPKTPDTNKDDIFALFDSNKGEELLKREYYKNGKLFVRYTEGVDALQLLVDGATVPDDEAEREKAYQTILNNIKNTNYIFTNGKDNGGTLEDAIEYFDEIRSNTEAVHKAKLDSINNKLMWCEIKAADPTVDKFWEIKSKGTPVVYSMSQIDEYRTNESRVGTNEILIIDKTRKPYGKIPEDKAHKNDKREVIGVIPIITTAANALYAQSMIDVAKEDAINYEAIYNLQSLDCRNKPYKYLGAEYTTFNVISSDSDEGNAVLAQRLNNEHTPTDNDDDFFDSLALNANKYFSSITLQADGGFDRENMKKIGLVVVKAFLDASEGNRISFQTVESFVGSLDRDAKNPNTGATTFIDTIVNEQSEYVNIFTNCMPTDSLKKTYNETVDILVVPHKDANVASMGFYEGMCEEDIDISESILKALDIVYDKVTDINERELDIVVDGGVSNIAQFIKTVYGKKGFYDPASPDAAVWKCKKDNDVKMWKTVIQKYDNFCKNIRKDCMFIADGPRPYCLQGQKKIVRPSKPTNTIDANILPYTKYLTGINTSYGAGYCDWFQVADEFSGDYFWCPPSIKACGVYIFTDLNFEYWDAPAGLNRGMVAALDVAFSPTNKQAGQIYTKSWNYAINYPQDGIILEGQRTFQTKPSALDRVNVRRLMLRLERAVYKVLRYVVYEGHTATLRQRVIDLIKPVFEQAKIGGGLYDYKLICDESINTPDVIDRNELKLKIGLKPTKTVEFIEAAFTLLNTGASWSEM